MINRKLAIRFHRDWAAGSRLMRVKRQVGKVLFLRSVLVYWLWTWRCEILGSAFHCSSAYKQADTLPKVLESSYWGYRIHKGWSHRLAYGRYVNYNTTALWLISRTPDSVEPKPSPSLLTSSQSCFSHLLHVIQTVTKACHAHYDQDQLALPNRKTEVQKSHRADGGHRKAPGAAQGLHGFINCSVFYCPIQCPKLRTDIVRVESVISNFFLLLSFQRMKTNTHLCFHKK